MSEQPAVFVECGADLDHEKFPFTRKHYMWPTETDKFRNHYNNVGVYQTIMHYINPVWIQNEKGKWLINAKDSFKYGDFYLDFDTVIESERDYLKLKEDVSMALKYLKMFMDIEKDQIRFYFSGNKGIHLTIDARVLGLEPHQALNQIYKDIVTDIAEYCKHKTLDVRVYDDKRMFRMTNSINKKSGLYKIPITYEEFKTLSYEKIQQLATQPRELSIPEPLPTAKAKMQFKRRVEVWSEKIKRAKDFTGKVMELKVLPPCIKAMTEHTFRETIDERNNSGTALASFYYQQGLERGDTLQRLVTWGEENCLPPLKPSEMEIIVNSVYNGQYRYGCETLKKLSGVCDKDKCPIFNRAFNKAEEGEEVLSN